MLLITARSAGLIWEMWGRVLLVEVEGGMRNQMTWLIEQADSDDALSEAIETRGRISPDEDMRRLRGNMLSLDSQA